MKSRAVQAFWLIGEVPEKGSLGNVIFLKIPPCAPSGTVIQYAPFSTTCGAVAQLDRASDYESEGCGFDSRRPRHMWEKIQIAGWSSLVARQAHNLKVVGSNPAPATKSGRMDIGL